jgi:hypothetical protein
MTDRLISLWPEQIKKDVLSPKAILNMQARAVSNLTGGILQGEVHEADEADDKVSLTFYLVVPALHDYRHQIMRIAHRKNLPYPAVVQAEIFSSINNLFRLFLAKGEFPGTRNRADNDDELIEIVRSVLQSAEVVSVTQSLIARANEVLEAEQTDPSGPDHNPAG